MKKGKWLLLVFIGFILLDCWIIAVFGLEAMELKTVAITSTTNLTVAAVFLYYMHKKGKI